MTAKGLDADVSVVQYVHTCHRYAITFLYRGHEILKDLISQLNYRVGAIM